MSDHEITRVRPGARNAQTLCGYCGDPVRPANGAGWEHDGETTKPKYPAHRYRVFIELADLPDDAIAAHLGVSLRTVQRYRVRFTKESRKAA